MSIFDNITEECNPGKDFYKFATGKWIDFNPQPDEYPCWCNFTKLDDVNINKINDIILNPDDSILSQKMNKLYNIVMNYNRRNAEGLEPLKKYINEKIYPIATYEEFYKFIATEHCPLLFSLFIDIDSKDSNMHILSLWQGGLSLGNKEYYISKDPEKVKIKEAFKTYLKDMLIYYGYSEKEAIQKVKWVMRFETKMARVSYSIEDQQEPSLNYNKMSVDDLSELTHFDWQQFLVDYGYDETTEINVSQIDPIKKACKLLALTPLEELKDYLEIMMISAADTSLDDKCYDIYFAYNQVITGAKEQTPKWKRAVNVVDSICSDIIGQIYVQRYFSENDKEVCEDMVNRLKQSFKNIIQEQSWMSDEAKTLAVKKLDSMRMKIGYPNKFEDLSGLPVDETLSYYDNLERITKFFFEFDKKLHYNKPVDKDEWHMSPQCVNAYYSQDNNEIVFPAAILQSPFFNANVDPVLNFGAIGVIIGHEMTHGFDNHGRQFDVNGNMFDWWTDEDVDKFNELTKNTEEHFNNLDVLPGLKCNGKLTLSENLADYGGIKIAYNALKNYIEEKGDSYSSDKYTWQQRFFIAYANVWAGVNTDENIRIANDNNEHSAMHMRVNGILPMFNPWYEAFNINESNELYTEPEKRARIW